MSNEQKLAERFPSMRDAPVPLEAVHVQRDAEPMNGSSGSHIDSASPPSVRDNSSVRDNPPVDPLAALKAAVHDLDLARRHARRCREATLEARGAFAKALENWNRTMPVMTQEQQARAFCATSQADRARRAAAGQAVYYPGVTKTARALAGGGHNVKQGGGSSYRRGAFTKTQALEIEAGKLRAAAAAAAAAAKPQR
jgi:hypothetical protein